MLVPSTDLGTALRRLGDSPADCTVVELEAPAPAPVRAFLRAHGRRTGGWLNRSWSLAVADVAALASLADAIGAPPARVVAASGHATGIAASRVWITERLVRTLPFLPA